MSPPLGAILVAEPIIQNKLEFLHLHSPSFLATKNERMITGLESIEQTLMKGKWKYRLEETHVR